MSTGRVVTIIRAGISSSAATNLPRSSEEVEVVEIIKNQDNGVATGGDLHSLNSGFSADDRSFAKDARGKGGRDNRFQDLQCVAERPKLNSISLVPLGVHHKGSRRVRSSFLLEFIKETTLANTRVAPTSRPHGGCPQADR